MAIDVCTDPPLGHEPNPSVARLSPAVAHRVGLG